MASSSQETDETLEWEHARTSLLNEPDGTKLRRTQSKQISTAPRFQKTWKLKVQPERLIKYSYIKFGDTIYRMGEKIGAGSYGTVRYLTTESGETFVVKVAKDNYLPTEVRVARLQGYALQEPTKRISFYRNFKAVHKHYLPMRALGTALSVHIPTLRFDDLESRLNIAIKLCMAMHRLHHLHGHAHLDTRPQNATFEAGNGNVHLIDYGASEPDPAGLAHNPMGTYQYRPPRSRRYTREELDSIALKRTIHMPYSIQTAQLACDSTVIDSTVITEQSLRDHKLILLWDEHLKTLGLQDVFSTDHTSVETFKAHHQTPLYMAARLVCAKYSISSQQLAPFTCLLLTSLYEQHKTAEDVHAALANPNEWLCEYLKTDAGSTDKAVNLRAKFICRSLEIEWSDTLATHAETLYRLAITPGFLLHLKFIAREPLLLQRLSQESRPEILSAVKGLLDNIPSQDAIWRVARILTFLDKPNIAPLLPAAECALSLSERYGLHFSAQELQKNTSLALLINRLEAVGIADKTRDFLDFEALIPAVIRDSSDHELLWTLADTPPGAVTFREMLKFADFIVREMYQGAPIVEKIWHFINRQHANGDLNDLLDGLMQIAAPKKPAYIYALLTSGFDEAHQILKEPSPSSSPSTTHARVEDLQIPYAPHAESVEFGELDNHLRALGAKINALPQYHTKKTALRNWCDAVQKEIASTRNGKQDINTFVSHVKAFQTPEFLTAIGEHRGILGLLNRILSDIMAVGRVLSCQGGTPRSGTFFKTESEHLIESAITCVEGLGTEIEI